MRSVALWIALMGSVVLFVRIFDVFVMPSEKDSDIVDSDFSGARARVLTSRLTKSIGPRLAGTRENELLAVSCILREISEIDTLYPGRLEVSIQRGSGMYKMKGRTFHMGYSNLTNVAIRVVGKSTDTAILVGAHFDSADTSPGSSDDGMNVALGIELLRNLASRKQLELSVIVLLNGAEEVGLLGAALFVEQHEWFSTVGAFYNLEAVAGGRKSLLFRTSGNAGVLLDAYMQESPWPYGTSMGQDVYNLGLISSTSDSVVFSQDDSVAGLDFSYMGNGAVYHTRYDDMGAISVGAFQQGGGNLLATVTALADTVDLRSRIEEDGDVRIFVDFLGISGISVRSSVAKFLLLLVTIVVAADFLMERRLSELVKSRSFVGVALSETEMKPTKTQKAEASQRVTSAHPRWSVALGVLAAIFVLLLTPVLSAALAAVTGFVCARMSPNSYYSHSWMIYPLFGFPVACVVVGGIHITGIILSKAGYSMSKAQFQTMRLSAILLLVVYSLLLLFGVSSGGIFASQPAFILVSSFLLRSVASLGAYVSRNNPRSVFWRVAQGVNSSAWWITLLSLPGSGLVFADGMGRVADFFVFTMGNRDTGYLGEIIVAGITGFLLSILIFPLAAVTQKRSLRSIVGVFSASVVVFSITLGFSVTLLKQPYSKSYPRIVQWRNAYFPDAGTSLLCLEFCSAGNPNQILDELPNDYEFDSETCSTAMDRLIDAANRPFHSERVCQHAAAPPYDLAAENAAYPELQVVNASAEGDKTRYSLIAGGNMTSLQIFATVSFDSGKEFVNSTCANSYGFCQWSYGGQASLPIEATELVKRDNGARFQFGLQVGCRQGLGCDLLQYDQEQRNRHFDYQDYADESADYILTDSAYRSIEFEFLVDSAAEFSIILHGFYHQPSEAIDQLGNDMPDWTSNLGYGSYLTPVQVIREYKLEV